MTLELAYLSNSFDMIVPQGLLGWVGWLAFLGLILYLGWRWRAYNKPWKRAQLLVFIGLLILIPLTNIFPVLRLPEGGALSLPGRPAEIRGPTLALFSALPWLLAAGLLGPTPAAILGLLSGFITMGWDTYNPFTPLEFSLLATLAGAAFQQRYRSLLFRLLRLPLITSILLMLIFPVLYLGDTLLAVTGNLTTRVDYALAGWGYVLLAMALELLVAGVFGQVVALAVPHRWGSNRPLIPSPIERQLQTRFFINLAPLVILLVFGVIASDWIIAGQAARNLLGERIQSTASQAADSIPFFLETGQGLITEIANDSRWYQGTLQEINDLLEENVFRVPFFNEMYLLNDAAETRAGFPNNDPTTSSLLAEETAAKNLALGAGVPFQYYSILPSPEGITGRVSFIAAIRDNQDRVRGVLIGRVDLAANPMVQPILATLKSLNLIDGEGMLLDGEQRVMYSSQEIMVMETYPGDIPAEATLFDDTAADGTRQMVYYQPVIGCPWSVVATVPAHQTHQMALQIAVPPLGMILLLSITALIILRLSLHSLTGSLQTLAQEANRISSGQLDRPLMLGGEDEIGQLRRSFENMRLSLKARLDELNHLLTVSKGVASSLEFAEAVKPVLESALGMGACSVRIALAPDTLPEIDASPSPASHFGAGPACGMFASMDEQILTITRQQERVALTNPSRVRLLTFPPGAPRPESLLALPLRLENQYYGVLWIVYDTPHAFSEDEIRFQTTLAGQAAMAAANARLFANAEVGRQRLALILDSTPDAVLVTDRYSRLLLINPAAQHLLGINPEIARHKPIDRVVKQPELVRLFSTLSNERQTTEVTLPNNQIYLATASSVLAEGHPVGRICLLRDITHFKELDALKSDFVATVSHDLRSPLTVMRGYTTMLEMVGELNEQQNAYVHKIVTSVEDMTRLVTSLLDLGRIEAGINLQLEMVPLHDIIKRVVGAYQLHASQKQIQITTEISPDTIPLVEADQALLQQAMSNLLENAISYTESNGRITVRVRPDQERMVFEVSDTGVGIAPLDIPRLFEKFYRGGQRGTKKHQGTGLGLAIVKSIVEQHNGQVWVESQLGKGSTFFFTIPFRQPRRKK
jgi:two-component system phosphate regulon sensor histidine kinase PhoR